MIHEPLYKVEQRLNAYCVYKRNFGSEGGWVLIKCFQTEEEANSWIWKSKADY